jgi:hypothetical protein
MSNIGKKWTKEEDSDLIKSYTLNSEFLDVNKIAEIHERTPLAIASRLVLLNIAEDIPSVRGFSGKIPQKLINLKAKNPEKVFKINCDNPKLDDVNCPNCLLLKQKISALENDMNEMRKINEELMKFI